MYNHQLDTFLLTAKVGSFSAAAEKLYISPSAVNQQITALETNLGTKLFERTHHGLKLTPAGKALLDELPSFVAHSEHIRTIVSDMSSLGGQTILVGIPHMHNIRLFYEYWAEYAATCTPPAIKLSGPDTWNPDAVFKFYSQCDLVEYVDINSDWMKDRKFVKLMDMPVSFAVPRTHPLAVRGSIGIGGLRGSRVVCARGAFTRKIAPGLHRLEEAGVTVEYVERYSPEMLENCLLNNYLTIVLELDPKIPASFTVIPCDWGVTVPYGFSVKKNPSQGMCSFLAFVSQRLGGKK